MLGQGNRRQRGMIEGYVEHILRRDAIVDELFYELPEKRRFTYSATAYDDLDLPSFNKLRQPAQVFKSLNTRVVDLPLPPGIKCVVNGFHGFLLTQIENKVKNFRFNLKVLIKNIQIYAYKPSLIKWAI